MKGEIQNNCSKLLEFAAADDLIAFESEVEKRGCDVDEMTFWYGRSFGSRKMGFEERSPIMIASLYGSTQILKHILATGKVNVNRACGSDGATALHCAAAGGSWSCVEAVELLIAGGGDTSVADANGKNPGDLIPSCVKSWRRKLEILLNGVSCEEETPRGAIGIEKKEYPIDVCLPDINIGVYGSDEFRMYSFKVKPCSRAYSHDWTECPFVHPGENARRRDPSKYNYTCVPCPEFKKGSCGKGDSCEYAHGVFESWLHPAQYRTRLCKDETSCARKVCFFAHRPDELRPLYASTGSAIPSSSPSVACSSPMWQTLQLPGSRLKTAYNARDIDLDRIRTQQRQQLVEEMAGLSSPYRDLQPTNLDDVFGSSQIRQLRASYPSPSSSRKPVGFAALSKRSQSFIDRSGANYGYAPSSPRLEEWGSPDGKLEWGFNGQEVNKLRKSASFGFRGSPNMGVQEPDVSWVNTLVKDEQRQGIVNDGMPHWLDQMYIDKEQIVA
ncbi:hypothetical protein ACS0TY_033853 [Phlomoides rotata]